MSDSRLIRMRDPSARQRSKNPSTLFFSAPEVSDTPRGPSCEVAFLTAWPTIRRVCTRVTDRTLAVFAIDESGVSSHALLPTHPADIRTAIIGRHSSADVCLPADSEISLRHLALVIHPDPTTTENPAKPIRFRLLDLRTNLGFTDERGTPAEHLGAEGPLMVQVGAYALILLPLDGRMTWTEDPKRAWDQLPVRTYTRQMPGGGDRGAQTSPLADWPAAPGTTGIQVIRGPRFAHRDLAVDEEELLGRLDVRSSRGSSSLALGAKALKGGVLLGRYDRCDNAGMPVLSDHRISRVHLLFLQIRDWVFAIDTASTNGVWSNNIEVRHRLLGTTDTLELGCDLAHVSWKAT